MLLESKQQECSRSFELERKELESVLGYIPISRSTSLAQILRYICRQYFAGRAAQIKEYNIGVDALSRPVSYQPRLDPIVRVEISRLRKRLAAYYETEGKNNPLRLTVPVGQYAPLFESRTVLGLTAESKSDASAKNGRTPAGVDSDAGAHCKMNGLREAERAEFQAVINSEELRRSPTVLRLAEYIGQRYFAGEEGLLKEYSIAVDVLGRDANSFDSKQDSIVRVEAHRLRKKLDRYYQGEGRDHPVRFTLEPGQYIPKFVQLPESKPEALPIAEPRREASGRQAGRSDLRWFHLAGICAAALILILSLYASLRIQKVHANAKSATIRLMSGAPGVSFASAPLGLVWQGDQWFSGGSTVFAQKAAVSLPDAALHAQRQGNFEYAIPLPASTYEMRLYFAPRLANPDTLDTVQTHRFDVLMKGVKIMDALDRGNDRNSGSKWTIRVFRDARADRDGKLHLTFRSQKDIAYVSGIELAPGRRGKLMPIRMIAKTSPFTDAKQRVWSFERYVEGGELVSRTERFPPDLDANIYSGERYGSFSYKIPVSPGRYRLRLYFAETWFDPSAGRGGIGSRRFDVYVNGAPLLQNFDLLREAGGSYHAVIKEFRDLQPDLDGAINLKFIPRTNYACLNALELLNDGN